MCAFLTTTGRNVGANCVERPNWQLGFCRVCYHCLHARANLRQPTPAHASSRQPPLAHASPRQPTPAFASPTPAQHQPLGPIFGQSRFLVVHGLCRRFQPVLGVYVPQLSAFRCLCGSAEPSPSQSGCLRGCLGGSGEMLGDVRAGLRELGHGLRRSF